MGCCGSELLYIGKNGRSHAWTGVAPTLYTNAFTPGIVLSNLMQFDCAVLEDGGTGIIDEVAIYEKAATGAPLHVAMDLILFNEQVTVAAAGSAYAAPADPTQIVSLVQIAAAEYMPVDGAVSLALVAPINANVQAKAGSRSLWGVLVAREADDYATGATMTVQLRITRD